MHNDFLHIHDEDESTQGGPPGWLAFTTITTAYFSILIVMLLYCVVVR